MKRWGWILVALHGMLATGFAAAPNSDVVVTSPVSVARIEKDANRTSMTLQLAEPLWASVQTERGSVFQAEYPEVETMSEMGAPAVPVASRFFRLPAVGGVSVQVVNAEYETLADVDYAIYLGEGEAEPLLGKNMEPVDAWFPEVLAYTTEPVIIREFRAAMLVTHPVQVNPARREVRVYSNIDVELNFTSEPSINELPHQPTQISENFLSVYRDFLDWSENELNEFTLYRGGVQVVTKAVALPALQGWIDWKRQKGWDIHLLTEANVTSWSATAIRNELISRFNNSDPKFEFVVIIGDDAGAYSTPPGTGSGYGAGDLGYSTLAGADQIPDVAIGRISVETETQLVAYKNKVLFYEKTPYTADPGWFTRGMVAAGSASSGMSTILIGRYARHAMLNLGYTQVDTAWYNDGLGAVNPRCSTALNAGVSFYTYRGWLGTGLGDAGINALNNTHKLPYVIDVTCSTGNWAGGTGYNESWMRAGTPAAPKGGIGAISTATSSTHTRPNNAITGGGIKSVLVDRNPHMGMSWYWALLNLYKNLYMINSGEVLNFSTWNNLMGDPTVWLWTAAPRSFTVNAPTSFLLGTNGYSVALTENGQPVRNAWVTLYKVDDDEEVIARGVSDANGNVTLDAPIRHTGTAILTITKQNFVPAISNVAVVSGDRVGFVDVQIIDDGSEGTSGNGNGLVEAGETVGLRFLAKNYSENSYPNVQATLSEDDPWIGSITGTGSFGTMAGGAETLSSSLILVQILPGAQHDWITRLPVTFSSGATQWQDIVSVTLHAPQFAMVQPNLTGTLNPGTAGALSLVLRNVGGSFANSGTAMMYSQDSYLGVETGAVPFVATAVGQNVNVGPFTLYAHPDAFRGYPANYRVVLTSSTGQIDTVYSQITLGARRSQDPLGPDRYGYFAFDNTDTEYDIAPDYNWVEINPSAPGSQFNGTRLNSINDSAEEDDDTQVVALPFPITYYGTTFQHATVAGNGFIAMGRQPDMYNARNWTIPSPLGPNFMIAPYWDDRQYNPQASGVYMYHDAPNGRFIVEWYQAVDRYQGSPCTFQVIFYDQVEGHVTLTGDNEFLFQYNTMTHSVGENGVDVPYFTTGIENGDQTDGLMCAYNNTATPGMAPINNGRAILFSTQLVPITGNISGRVTAAADGTPMEGILVHTQNWIFQTTTDANGDYLLENVIIGVHDVIASGSCINTATVNDVIVDEDETTTVNFQVTVPQFAVDPEEIGHWLQPDGESNIPLLLTNDGDGPTEFRVGVDFWGPTSLNVGEGDTPRGPVAGLDELDDLWDLLFQVDLDPTEMRYRGVTHDEQYFWVSGSNNFDTSGPNKLYQFTSHGELLNVFDQPVPEPDVVGFYSLTWDGQYLYGAQERVLYQMQYTGTDVELVDSWSIPANPARYLAYDPVNDWFWMGDYSTPLYAVDRTGTIQSQYSFEFGVAAVGYYAEDPDGMNLYLVSRDAQDVTISVRKMDTATGNTLFVNQLPADGYQIKDIEITYYWNPMFWTLNALFDGLANHDRLKVWEAGNNAMWMQLSAEEGVIPPGGEFNLTVTVRGLGLPEGEYGAWLRFDHHTCDEVSFVEVNLMVSLDADPEISVQPLDWSFDGAYPNPFNPSTSIRFTLKESAHVKARLFNVMGQEVAKIKDGRMTAGHHQVTFNGSNLASGVYFLAFEAGPMHTTRKLVLLK